MSLTLMRATANGRFQIHDVKQPTVARMERSDIRDSCRGVKAVPHFAPLNAGYGLLCRGIPIPLQQSEQCRHIWGCIFR